MCFVHSYAASQRNGGFLYHDKIQDTTTALENINALSSMIIMSFHWQQQQEIQFFHKCVVMKRSKTYTVLSDKCNTSFSEAAKNR